MSGGSFDYAYADDAAQLISKRRDDDLREMADVVEDPERMAGRDLSEEDAAQVASLLRAKADTIEAARRSVEDAFHSDLRDLMKAIEWASSGDSFRTAEVWGQYGVVER